MGRRTRMLVIDAYVDMSKRYLPPNLLQVWFGPGGVMSDPSGVTETTVSRPEVSRVVQQQVSPPPPVEVEEAYRLPQPTPLPVPRMVRQDRPRVDQVDNNVVMACELIKKDQKRVREMG